LDAGRTHLCDHHGVTPTHRDPLEGIDRLLVDGTNLLHAMRRGADPAPASTLIGRLRAVVPPEVGIEIVLDGPPDPGSGNVRAASGLVVRYAGRISADALLIRLVTEAGQVSLQAAMGILVVTDDGALGTELRRRGATTVRTPWLLRRLDRTVRATGAPSIGRPKPTRPPSAAVPDRDADAAGDSRRWAPGRGATAKRGNPRRTARSARPADGR
jgi:hypothetical protein